jgi:nucleoside-diphosphate-sugar epimerase
MASRVLVIGGTGFLGHAVVRRLVEHGHHVTLLHRGSTRPETRTPGQILGDRNRLAECRSQIERARPDIVIDLIVASAGQARGLFHAAQGIAGRTIIASSGDVYLASDILSGRSGSPLEPAPLSETAAVRSRMYPYRGSGLPKSDWWDPETYDKLEVEGIALANSATLPTTILRLPMLYGPGDKHGVKRRFYPFSKRMADTRRFLLLSEIHAAWCAPWGYLDNVAQAFVLAVEKPLSAGKIYNVCEEGRPAIVDWIRLAAEITGWKGRLITGDGPFPAPDAPGQYNLKQHLDMDSARIRAELGYREIVERREALRRTIEWELAHPPEFQDRNQFDYAAEDAALDQLLESLPQQHSHAHQQS